MELLYSQLMAGTLLTAKSLKRKRSEKSTETLQKMWSQTAKTSWTAANDQELKANHLIRTRFVEAFLQTMAALGSQGARNLLNPSRFNTIRNTGNSYPSMILSNRTKNHPRTGHQTNKTKLEN